MGLGGAESCLASWFGRRNEDDWSRGLLGGRIGVLDEVSDSEIDGGGGTSGSKRGGGGRIGMGGRLFGGG